MSWKQRFIVSRLVTWIPHDIFLLLRFFSSRAPLASSRAFLTVHRSYSRLLHEIYIKTREPRGNLVWPRTSKLGLGASPPRTRVSIATMLIDLMVGRRRRRKRGKGMILRAGKLQFSQSASPTRPNWFNQLIRISDDACLGLVRGRYTLREGFSWGTDESRMHSTLQVPQVSRDI